MGRQVVREFFTSLRFTGGGAANVAAPNALGLPGTASYTQVCWVRFGSVIATGTAANGNGSYVFDRNGTMNAISSVKILAGNLISLQRRYDDGTSLTATGNVVAVPGQWYQVMVTRQYGVAFRIYVNGVLAGTLSDNGNALTLPPPRLGRNNGFVDGFDGWIDAFAIFDTYADDADAAAYYASGIHPRATTPILRWRCNEGSGTTVADDGSLGTNTATLGANVAFSSIVPMVTRQIATTRQAIQDFKATLALTGGSAAGSFELDTAGFAGFSAQMFVKLRNNGTNVDVMFRSAGYSDRIVGLQSTREIRFALACATNNVNLFSPMNTLQDNVWYEIVVTYNGATSVIYVNGVAVATASTPFGVLASGQGTTWTLGSGASKTMNLGRVRMWARGLTANDVSRMYQSGVPPTAGLFVNWLAQEGAGTVVYDNGPAFPNGNNITIVPAVASFSNDVPMRRRLLVNENLVPNGNFEYAPVVNDPHTGASGRWIDGTAAGSTGNDLFKWALGSAAGLRSVVFDSSVKYSGQYSLKLSTLAANTTTEAWSYVPVTIPNTLKYAAYIPDGVAYTLSYWMKTNYVSGDGLGARAGVIIRNAAGGSTTSPFGTPVKTTTDWTKYTLTGTASGGFNYFMFQCRVTGTGSTNDLIMDAWFDEIDFRPTTPNTRLLAA